MSAQLSRSSLNFENVLNEIRDKVARARVEDSDIEIKVKIDLRPLGPCTPLNEEHYTETVKQTTNHRSKASNKEQRGAPKSKNLSGPVKKSVERLAVTSLAPTDGWLWPKTTPRTAVSQTTIYENADITDSIPPPAPPLPEQTRKT
ncbi:unnamed protein product, partial [Mesorhabditis belari]|uniref:Uncharacterized protein n=1 Tax=Mesorhabditis belari TaxID=2138241 RepID=A0AAF3JA91_9BILA